MPDKLFSYCILFSWSGRGFEGIFWTGKYFSPPALLKSWPWVHEVCKPYPQPCPEVSQMSGKLSVVFVGAKNGECFQWRALALPHVNEHGVLWESWGDAVFSPWLVLLESCRSPFGAQHVRHKLQTITKQTTKRIKQKELEGQEVNLFHTHHDENWPVF